MYRLKTRVHFDSAHFLYGYDGKCSNIHGHRWLAEITIRGESLIENGTKKEMLVDFSDFKNDMKKIADSLDHTLIYEDGTLKPRLLSALEEEKFSLYKIPFRPTAENLAKYIFDITEEKGYCTESVAVYETPDNCAVYSGE